jgi:hypothetical protein
MGMKNCFPSAEVAQVNALWPFSDQRVQKAFEPQIDLLIWQYNGH